jgi:hypothetical protein
MEIQWLSSVNNTSLFQKFALNILRDNIASNEDPGEMLNTFPYLVWQNETLNSPAACIAQCQLYGYNAAGLEYGKASHIPKAHSLRIRSLAVHLKELD